MNYIIDMLVKINKDENFAFDEARNFGIDCIKAGWDRDQIAEISLGLRRNNIIHDGTWLGFCNGL